MKFCKCNYPLIILFAVRKKEYACFDCGETYEFFDNYHDHDPTQQEKEKQKQAELRKKYFMKRLRGSNPLSTQQFKKWVETFIKNVCVE